ncbi:hypothetical protein HK096_003907 [Nowakowskiella sp. JEL0078]|nr:hypothetical protein HK096_003907 [Nowakowskiella sp. JEL0078]
MVANSGNLFILAVALLGSVPSTFGAATSACTATSYAAIANVKSCTSILLKGPFTVPANKVVDLTGLKSGTTIQITGTITFAKGTLDKTNDLLTIGGSSITVDGTGGTLDGNGPSYWDGLGGNGGVNKPKFIRLKIAGGTQNCWWKVVNSPIHTFSISSSSSLTISGVTIDNRGSKQSLGHNTDAFDVSSTGVTITGATVYNQDDCLAVNNANGVNFTNNKCDGGHGISIGSVKTGSTVKSVTVSDCTISNSDNGVRIKMYNDATGASIDTITYKNIALSNIAKYGIVIQQDYTNSGATGTPGTKSPISNVVLNNIHGTVKSSGTNVYILCGNCSKFTFSQIAITGGKAASCKGISPKPTGC